MKLFTTAVASARAFSNALAFAKNAGAASSLPADDRRSGREFRRYAAQRADRGQFEQAEPKRGVEGYIRKDLLTRRRVR